MYNFLIIESDERVLDLLTQGLGNEFDANIITEFDFDSVEQILNTESVDLVIVRNSFELNMRDIQAAKLLMNLVYDLEKGPPIIVLGEFEFVGQHFDSLPDRFRIEELYRTVIKVLEITPEQIQHFKLPDYVSLAIENFFLIDHAPCDFYIKIVSVDGERFLKRINSQESIDREVIEKYQNNRVRSFYVKKEDHPNLLNHLLQQSLEKIVKVGQSSKSIHEINSETYGISQNLIDAIGVTEHTIRLANASIASMVKSVRGSRNLKSMLEELLSNPSSYAYKRNYLISALCCELAPLMEWGSGDQLDLQIEKMTFFSFFHDIFIKEEQHLKIFSNQQVKELDLQTSELVLNHANKAASLIQSFPRTPGGVDLLIKQHHGTTSGVGFAQNFTTNISPMAIAFIVVEKYAYHILEMKSDDLLSSDKKMEIFNKLYAEFSLPSYRKIVESLEKISIS
ncbi:hypothetical protein [Halobacteriovorax sp. HLS]|uniref:hypothetical protein n=1 Tax=Halobacteriovorax sp. HLS TaxID=2234000 RepID=UPI000FDC993C|nr:hypothetical protein [Halobacteriovorax sp. HLS]